MSRAGGNALMKLLSGDKKKKKTKKGVTDDLGSVFKCLLKRFYEK